MKKFLAVLALVGVLVPGLASAQTAEQAVTALENAWLTAFTTGDTAWHEKNLAAGAVMTNEKGELRDKAATIAIGTETDKGTENGKDASGTYRWTDTWVKINGQWQCVASQSSTIVK
jgi:hypothetical protein